MEERLLLEFLNYLSGLLKTSKCSNVGHSDIGFSILVSYKPMKSISKRYSSAVVYKGQWGLASSNVLRYGLTSAKNIYKTKRKHLETRQN